jgi:hypothetical protein
MAQDDDDLPLLCDILFRPEYSIKNTEYAGAVSLISVLQDNPLYYTRYIQQRGDDFLQVMNAEEQSAKEIAYDASVLPEENIDSDVVISGRSPRVTQQLADTAQVYENLMTFVSNVRANIVVLCNLMLNLVDLIHQQVLTAIPVEAARTARVYDNISLVMGAPQQIFPKFSFNIVCEKDPLLQTILVAGRENGMGKVLNDFVFRQLQPHAAFLGYATLKVVEPSESNRLWQVKISIHENDFIFFTIQIINVKNEFFTPGVFPVPPQTVELRRQLGQLYENLFFSLYNKANSKDFNCLCSLSELDSFILTQIGVANLNLLEAAIQNFLINLVDAQVNVKRKYFILALYNLIYCSSQPNYTIETKVYRWLFDRPVLELNIVRGQNNKNVFLYAMRIIQNVNILCNEIDDGEQEKIRFVMGGGKQYSLFQKALNKFSINNLEVFNIYMQRVIDETYPNDETPERTLQRQALLRELTHTVIKAAADADFGFFHKRGALGSIESMSVCMLLQLALKKLIDVQLVNPPATPYAIPPATPYAIDIGNSCIGNPPTTLSSLRMILNNSLLFYNNLEGVTNEFTGIINRLLGLLRMDLNDIDSTISPFDLVPKGSMEDYIHHIIEAVLLFFNVIHIPEPDLTNLYQLLSKYSMITVEGFSSPLKGIFDIFYTLFIIQNFTNRALVTQKINKELKRISICAQILYFHYVELIPLVEAAAIQIGQQPGTGNATITPMLDILRGMIIYGYNGNLLDPDNFRTIMGTYARFIQKLIDFNALPFGILLNFYCVIPMPPNSRATMTITETFFMNLLENSNHEPPPPAAAAVAVPAADLSDIPEAQRNILLTSLQCIRASIAAIREMYETRDEARVSILERLYQNKVYASYRDTQNKRNSIVVISIAYQSFLWDIRKRPIIQGHIVNPAVVAADNDNFRQAMGLFDIFSGGMNFFNQLLAAVAPCYRENLLDISVDEFDGIQFDTPVNRVKFQFMFWFLTCIFGIKTKSAPKKIISIARAYLNYIMESFAVVDQDDRFVYHNLFGCRIAFPKIPNPAPANIELLEHHGELVAAPQRVNYDNVLFLAYDPYTIGKALKLYKNAEQNYRENPENFVFKVGNTIAIRKDSAILRKDILSKLTDAFSKLPKGQAYLNQSYIFMNTVLMGVIGHLGGDTSVRNILTRISGIQGILTDNPYKPTAHDVSKFIDFRETPQEYRNEWINYLLTEIFNSGDNGDNLFNHMKLLVLLFKYLILLPAYLETVAIVIQDGRQTTVQALGIAQILIGREYGCATIQLASAVEREQLGENGIAILTHNIQDAQATTRQRNTAATAAATAAAAAAAAAAAPVRHARRAAARVRGVPAAIQSADAIGIGIERERAATPAAVKKPRQGGGTIRFRNPSSPKKPNNHTRRNKNKRKNKKHKSSPKHRKVIPSSRSGSQSNRKKSKPKKSQKNVTFKRRRPRK